MSSLYDFMKINRGLYFNKVVLPGNEVGEGNPPSPPHVITTGGYVLSDFGENAINNHGIGDVGHSEKNQVIFNAITKNYRNRCTSIQSYNTDLFPKGGFNSSKMLEYAKIAKADIVYTPYVNAATWTNGEYYDFVLPIGSHYDNDGTDGILGNDDRHDLTPNAGTLLINSVAVSARRDTPEGFMKSTSYGFGMEFFEDCSPEALNPVYPDKDIPICFWECKTNEAGTIISNARTQSNSPVISPTFWLGQDIWVVKADGQEEHTTITSFIDCDNFNVFPALTPIVGTTLYSWHLGTLGEYIGGQAQSWAVPLVAGKLKVIRLRTGASWDIVREAARATAKRNIAGIPNIDDSNWDMYRGFGCIDVEAAVNHINNMT
ncbi:MAG: hypothetical protein QM800_12675 [Paludibacter sp.]